MKILTMEKSNLIEEKKRKLRQESYKRWSRNKYATDENYREKRKRWSREYYLRKKKLGSEYIQKKHQEKIAKIWKAIRGTYKP